VRAYSEETLVQLRRERGDQLALTRQQRGRATHDALGELRQMFGAVRLERKKMQDLRDRDPR